MNTNILKETVNYNESKTVKSTFYTEKVKIPQKSQSMAIKIRHWLQKVLP